MPAAVNVDQTPAHFTYGNLSGRGMTRRMAVLYEPSGIDYDQPKDGEEL